MNLLPDNIPVKIENTDNIKYNDTNNQFYYYDNPPFSPSTPPEQKIIYQLINKKKQHKLRNYYTYTLK